MVIRVPEKEEERIDFSLFSLSLLGEAGNPDCFARYKSTFLAAHDPQVQNAQAFFPALV